MKTGLLLFVAAHLAMVGMADAQAKDPWIGKRVITRFGTVLKVGDAVVDDQGRTASLDAGGRDRNAFRVYRVEHAKGEWLWLRDEKSDAAGWVRLKCVIPYQQTLELYTNQIRENPQAYLYSYRGLVWTERGELDLAIADFDEAIRLDPTESAYYCNRGRAWNLKLDYDRAISDSNEAIRLDPSYAWAYVNRGYAWIGKKNPDKAIADHSEAIRLDPRSSLGYVNRGNAWNLKKDYRKAIADYNQAIRLDPKDVEILNFRAWLWATCPAERVRDGNKAVESATRACELSEWKAANILGTLAAAYAESGDFDKAIDWQGKANKLYTDAEDKRKGEDRLKLYKDKKPYRDEGWPVP